jgi:UDP-galactopyranose mutase
LPKLVRVVAGTPQEIIDCADALEYMSLRVELLLAGRRLDTEIQRIYSADPEIPPHKIALNHNSSETLRNRPRHAVMAEVSVSADKDVDVDAIAPRSIDFLCGLGVLDSPDDIIWRSHVDVRYAYPVYTHERPGLVAAVKDWMVRHDVHTVGRFGEWEYVNSDKCVYEGLRLGEVLGEQSMADEPRRTGSEG